MTLTSTQKKKIDELKCRGYNGSEIANIIGISRNSVYGHFIVER